MAEPAIDVAITKIMAGNDPEIPIFNVVMTRHDGTWMETFGSRELLVAFLRGLSAASHLLGYYLPDPEIPQ